jgi:23S rRNA (adenine2030-N6)-methyltransferase
VSSASSRYAPDGTPDYSHRFHAGNVGDVWKHCALVEILRRAAEAEGSVRYVETHAGEGRYALGATGEWTEGIGRLWTVRDLADGAVGRYLALCRRIVPGAERPESYPGSPVLARAVLGDRGALRLWERDAAACERLRSNVAAAEISCDDGLGALASVADATVVLVDPPWTQKADWIAVPDALIAAARALPGACLVLWYPVKSLTRPNAMLARFETEGVQGTIAELVTTSLKHQRHRLNGSGLLLVRPPAGTLEALAAAAPVVGRLCATRQGAWSFRMHAW